MNAPLRHREGVMFVRAPVLPALDEPQIFDTTDDVSDFIVFDNETTTLISQHLRVGSFAWVRGRIGQPDTKVIAMGLYTTEVDHITDTERDLIDDYGETFSRHIRRIVKDQCRIAVSKDEKPNPGESASAFKAGVVFDVTSVFAPFVDFVEQNGGLPVMTRTEFADFLMDASLGRRITDKPIAIVAHNALFDMGALAAPTRDKTHQSFRSHIPVLAWGRECKQTGTGFSFCLCECEDRTFSVDTEKGVPFQLKAHCSRHPTLMCRNLSGKKKQWGWMQGDHSVSSGPVVDTSVCGRALLGPNGSVSLRALGERLRCAVKKREDETGHGVEIKKSYLDYLIIDVVASASVFGKLVERFNMYTFEDGSIANIYSEASVGKMMLRWLGVPRGISKRTFEFKDESTEVDVQKDVLDIHQQSYHGGRSEAPARLMKASVVYCDFKSQYPSINAMMGLQRYMLAERYAVVRGPKAVAHVQKILKKASLEWLGVLENWQSLPAIVQIECGGSQIPVRYKKNKKNPYGYVRVKKTNRPSAVKWFTLSDVIASKLYNDGNVPRILNACLIIPIGQIETPIRKLFGRDDLTIDLSREDLYIKLLQFRSEVKKKMAAGLKGGTFKKNSAEYVELDNLQESLKLVANATSYGILAETRQDKGSRERQGSYYAPFIATHITGGSRLLLAMAQVKARNVGRERFGVDILHALCDTDSMAFIKPEGVEWGTFVDVIDDVRKYFLAISPYVGSDEDRELFQHESMFYDDGSEDPIKIPRNMPVYVCAVSCKRYALYVVVDDKIYIAAAKSHGLGGYTTDEDVWEDPRGHDNDDNAMGDHPDGEAEPISKPFKFKGRSWTYQMWMSRIQLLEGRRNQEPHEPKHGGFVRSSWNETYVWQHRAVTTPGYLRRFAACGARPGSFFVQPLVMKKGAGRFSMIAPYAKAGAFILAGPIYRIRDGAEVFPHEAEIIMRKLWEVGQTYFVNPETKLDGIGEGFDQAPGYLTVPEHEFTDTLELDRKRREVSEGFGEDELQGALNL